MPLNAGGVAIAVALIDEGFSQCYVCAVGVPQTIVINADKKV